MDRGKKAFALTVVLSLLSAALSARQNTTVSGRVTSSFYTFERSDTVDTRSLHVRGYQSVFFDVRKKSVLFRTYAQVDNDFAARINGDARLRLYSFYLQWRPEPQDKATLQLGRVPVFGGVGAGTIDGAVLALRPWPRLRMKAFAGTLAPERLRAGLIGEKENNFLLGGELGLSPAKSLRINFSYFNKNQSRPGYRTLRSDSVGTVFTQFIEPQAQAFEFAGIDLSWQPRRSQSFYARTDFDMESRTVSRLEFSGRSRLGPRLTVSAAYTFRSPRLPWNSIFSVFNVEDNQELEAGLYYRPSRALRLFVNSALIVYRGDNSVRFSGGISGRFGSFNYVHRSGYAGELNGVNAAFYYPTLNGELLPSLMISWAAYELDRDDHELQNLLSAVLGLRYSPRRLFSLDTQIHLLSNRYYAVDSRFLLRLQYWFTGNSAKND